MPVQSRGTEAVFNALILASYDAQRGQLTNDGRAAFDNMWKLQLSSGNDKRRVAVDSVRQRAVGGS